LVSAEGLEPSTPWLKGRPSRHFP